MNNVRPRLTMLTEEQIQDIHQYTLKILETTGVRVDSPSALEMLRKRVGQLHGPGSDRADPGESWLNGPSRLRRARSRSTTGAGSRSLPSAEKGTGPALGSG